MKISIAARILADLAEKYPDYNLSVHADGAHHSRGMTFYAIIPMSEMQKEAHKSAQKWDAEAFDEPVVVTKFKKPIVEEAPEDLGKRRFNKPRKIDGIYEDPPF